MNNILPKDDLELHEAFEIIMSNERVPEYIREISELIFVDGLNQRTLKDILSKYHVNRIEDIRNDTMDLLLQYINIVLNDHSITEKERLNVCLLKRFFRIKEGDFYKLKYYEIRNIIEKQIEIIHKDEHVSYEEAMHKVELQEIFDLSYDQFMEIKDKIKLTYIIL